MVGRPLESWKRTGAEPTHLHQLLPLQANSLPQRVAVKKGGRLLQLNCFVDDCFQPVTPYTCFAMPQVRGADGSGAACAWSTLASPHTPSQRAKTEARLPGQVAGRRLYRRTCVCSGRGQHEAHHCPQRPRPRDCAPAHACAARPHADPPVNVCCPPLACRAAWF